jgi:hypothetical protein
MSDLRQTQRCQDIGAATANRLPNTQIWRKTARAFEAVAVATSYRAASGSAGRGGEELR